jgi:dynein heavy chain
MITAIAAHPGGGRSVLTQRFTRHFSIFNIQKSSDNVIISIFLQIVKGYLKIQNFKAEIIDMTAALVNSTLLLYN